MKISPPCAVVGAQIVDEEKTQFIIWRPCLRIIDHLHNAPKNEKKTIYNLATMSKGTKKFLKCVLASLSQGRFIISMIHEKMPDLLFGKHVYKDKKILKILHINIVIISKYALKHLASLFQDYSSQ